MGVKVREKIKGSGEWWIYIDHKGDRRANKVGSKRAALDLKTEIEKKIAAAEFQIRLPGPVPTFGKYAEKWMEGHVRTNLKVSTQQAYRILLDVSEFEGVQGQSVTLRVRWTVAGDMAMIEADGTITLLGRGSSSINSGGEKIFPEEVEAALKSHPAVFDAMVVGVPDERWGERIAAVVQPRAGSAPTLEELDAHCRTKIAGYKVPRELHLVDEIQRQPSGKPDYKWAKAVATGPGTAPAARTEAGRTPRPKAGGRRKAKR